MLKENFLKTMIETVKYDDYENQNELLSILRNSLITFDKTGLFARESFQYYENIGLRVPIPFLKEARTYQKIFNKIAGEIYIDTSDHAFGEVIIKPKIIESKNPNHIEHEVHFDKIKDEIIQGIRNSKYLIWVVVAWISDKEICAELIAKKNNGVDVKVIMSDEPTNNGTYISLTKNNIECIKTKVIGTNRMHNKFCIIDLNFVMHGSYNWSFNARENGETLTTALDKDFVLNFADKFISLYNENK